MVSRSETAGGRSAASRSSPGAHPALGDRIAGSVASRRSQIVLGLDPDPTRLWPRALELAAGAGGGSLAGGVREGDDDPRRRAGRAVAAHCRLLLDATAEQCVAIKPQLACFERLGAAGWTALEEIVADARARGLIVIADAKRGDIDISARAYGEAFFGGVDGAGRVGAVDGENGERAVSPFGPLPGLGADLLTASPLLGRDSLQALLDRARGAGGGLLALVRTSNPGARDVQDLELSDGRSVSDALAALVDELGRPGIGDAGLSDVGAVVGATAPEHLHRLREAMPHAVMLLPGVGAQGASGERLQAAFAPGPAGGLVSASRAIVYAFQTAGGAPEVAARDEAARLRELVWDLYG